MKNKKDSEYSKLKGRGKVEKVTDSSSWMMAAPKKRSPDRSAESEVGKKVVLHEGGVLYLAAYLIGA